MPEHLLTDRFDVPLAADAAEALEQLEHDLIDLEIRLQAGEVNLDLVHAVFRHANNLKSIFMVLGDMEAAALVHEIESHFDALRNGASRLSEEALSHCLDALDLMQQRLEGASAEGFQALAEVLRAALPHAEAAAPASAENEQTSEGPSEPPAEGDGALRVLVVEDDFMSRFTLREMLEDYGACDVAVNGKEAVAAFEMRLAQEQPYDLVCLDIMMPEMDGHETIKRLRTLEEEQDILGLDRTRVIMTTALDDAKHVMAAFSQQADAYLVKPLNFNALRAQMQKLGLCC